MRVFFVFWVITIIGFLPVKGQELFVGFIATESYDSYDRYNLYSKGINLEYNHKLPAFNLIIGYAEIHEGTYKLGLSNKIGDYFNIGMNILYFDKGFLKHFPVKFGSEFTGKFIVPISDTVGAGANVSVGFSTENVFYTIGLQIRYKIY